MRVALEFCGVLNATKATERCGDVCGVPIKIQCKWETLAMQERTSEKGFFCCPFLKSIMYYLRSVTCQDSLDSDLWLRSQRCHILSLGPYMLHPHHPVVRQYVLFYCDINNHNIIVWAHTSNQEAKIYSYLWYIITRNDIYGWDF